MKECTSCSVEKPITDFAKADGCKDGHRNQCKRCRSEAERKNWTSTGHRRSRSHEYKRQERFQRLYGITLRDYDVLLAQQDNKCAICRGNQSWNRREGDVLVVDHDHKTGRVRGLLCHACNQALGLMRDNPDLLLVAANYLEVKQEKEIKK